MHDAHLHMLHTAARKAASMFCCIITHCLLYRNTCYVANTLPASLQHAACFIATHFLLHCITLSASSQHAACSLYHIACFIATRCLFIVSHCLLHRNTLPASSQHAACFIVAQFLLHFEGIVNQALPFLSSPAHC
jgi:hypothetical protein